MTELNRTFILRANWTVAYEDILYKASTAPVDGTKFTWIHKADKDPDLKHTDANFIEETVYRSLSDSCWMGETGPIDETRFVRGWWTALNTK